MEPFCLYRLCYWTSDNDPDERTGVNLSPVPDMPQGLWNIIRTLVFDTD